jgi:acetyl-CoA C-acetyltransferase
MLETGKELSFEAVRMALDSAGIERKDVDSVVMGSAPDAFDGVHMKGDYLLDGAGGYRRQYSRVFVGGATGVYTPVAAWWHVASGMSNVCIAVGEEKMSPFQPHPQGAFLTIFDHDYERALGTTLLWIFALEMRRYMNAYSVKEEEIAQVAVKNKGNALDHPCAQLPAKITVEDVMKSEPIVWPVKRPLLPAVLGKRWKDGLQDGRNKGSSKGNRRSRGVRSLRLQGAPPYGGVAACEKR